MPLVAIFEALLPWMILLIVITQIVIPVIRGTYIWPILRSQDRQIDSKITEVNNETHLEELRDELRTKQSELNKRKETHEQ